jgi:hypothetical protein
VTKANLTREKDFQDTIVQTLEMFGYVVEHTYPLLTRPRGGQPVWRTGSTLKGKPDLIAVRPPRILAIEVKGENTVLEPDQRAVLSLYAAVPCARAWVIRPHDPPWPLVQRWIERPQPPEGEGEPAPRTYGFDVMTPGQARQFLHSRRRRAPSRRGSRGVPPSLPFG